MNREPRTHLERFVLCHRGLNDTSRRKLHFFYGSLRQGARPDLPYLSTETYSGTNSTTPSGECS